MWKICAILSALFLSASFVQAEDLPIFDGHMHYSQNSWETLSPEEVRIRMDKANVRWALVSSSPDAGTLRLEALMPGRIVAELRPYHGLVTASNWTEAPGISDYLARRLEIHKYVGIGEFHLYGPQEYDPVLLGRIAALAVKYGILLHAHSGAEQIERLYKIEPRLTVLWAHAGFTDDVETISQTMEKYPSLYAELSFRASDIASGNIVDEQWRKLFEDYPDRFIIGTDTYISSRWQEYEELVEEHRLWLKTLPRPLAEKIAWRNATRLFGITQTP